MAFLGSIGKSLGLGSTSSVLGSVAGPLISGGLSLLGGSSANSANAEQAQLNRDFQADQSSTAYQRAVADMKAAGLNPMLAYGQGGASTASGSTATMSDVVSPAVSSAMQASRLNADLQNIRQQNENLKANERKIVADTVSTTWANAKMKADIANSTAATQSQINLNKTLQMQAVSQAAAATASAKQMATNTKLSEANLPKAQNLGEFSKTKVGNFLDAVGKVIDDLSPFGHSAGALAK